MKLKLSTRITLIYALVFTLVLFAINAAVFVIVNFYNRSGDNLTLLTTKNQVQTILEEKGTILNRDLEDLGIRFPLLVQVTSNQEAFSSVPGLAINKGEPYSRISFTYLGKTSTQRARALEGEFIDSEQKGYKIVVAKSVEEAYNNREITILTTAIASLLGMLFSLAVGSYMSHASFLPIAKMRKSVEEIDAQHIHERVKVPSTGDELTELGNTFNSLLDRLDEAYTRQSKFVSDASHELRTPLTVIKGYVDLLDRWGSEDPEVLDESIRAIQEETKSMSQLVENLLFLAKGENLKLSLIPEWFDLRTLGEELAEETTMANPTKNISYEGDRVQILADRSKIKQMLRVFIDNALKFTPEDGLIRIKAESGQGKVNLSIRDNGDGIAKEDLPKLFERFYVADKARTKDKSGSGLGLSIAKWIADIHGGTITVDSELGSYTEFTVCLPTDGQILLAKAREVEANTKHEKEK